MNAKIVRFLLPTSLPREVYLRFGPAHPRSPAWNFATTIRCRIRIVRLTAAGQQAMPWVIPYYPTLYPSGIRFMKLPVPAIATVHTVLTSFPVDMLGCAWGRDAYPSEDCCDSPSYPPESDTLHAELR